MLALIVLLDSIRYKVAVDLCMLTLAVEHVEGLLKNAPSLSVFIDHLCDLPLYQIDSATVLAFFQQQFVNFADSNI